jgi:predicted enzyme related to lactoylglutathione lyase
MPAPIVFFDIAGPDVGALRAFYSRVFGGSVDGTGRFVVTVSSPLGAALREDPAQKRLYVGVEDVAATLLGVERNGGVVEAPRFEVPGVAVLGLFRDPAGNPMGLVELEAGRPKVP